MGSAIALSEDAVSSVSIGWVTPPSCACNGVRKKKAMLERRSNLNKAGALMQNSGFAELLHRHGLVKLRNRSVP